MLVSLGREYLVNIPTFTTTHVICGNWSLNPKDDINSFTTKPPHLAKK